jgi:hypothetical protein
VSMVDKAFIGVNADAGKLMLKMRRFLNFQCTLAPISKIESIFVPFRSQKQCGSLLRLSVDTMYDLSRTSFFFPSSLSIN